MKVLMHDYTGHAFTAQLGRALARRGADVVYASFAGFESPKGRVGSTADDHANFRAVQIDLPGVFDKNNLLKRQRQQLHYARQAADLVRLEKPDVVISSNSPIEVQEQLLDASHALGAGFVFWVQDIHAEAIGRIIGRNSRLLGRLAGAYYRRKEADLLRRSDAVVVIAQAFSQVLGSAPWGLDVSQFEIIENWANIDDLPQLPRDNAWARQHMRQGRRRLVYAGTLARKHNPDLLLDLARRLDADIYVFSQGAGADHVRDRAALDGLGNVIVRPWVRSDDLQSMLAGADILLAIIEADAGVFSVPSKVLSYLAAGRPILASIPPKNLAAMTVTRQGAGLVAAPGDYMGLVQHAQRLLNQPDLRAKMGRAGRAYAEKTFDIEAISARFEQVLYRSCRPGSVQPIAEPQLLAGSA